MGVGEDSTKPTELSTAFAGGAALLLASLANFLSYGDYPFFRPEVGLVVVGLLTICAVMAPFYRSQRQWGRSVLDGLLAMLFADLNTSWPTASVAFGLIVAVIGWRAKISLAGPMAIIGSIIFLTTVMGLGRNDGWIKEEIGGKSVEQVQPINKPAILHLILDEHLGIEGFREPDSDAGRLRDELSSTYVGAGFRLYGGAYSEHKQTTNSIPSMLNYGPRAGRPIGTDGVELGRVAELDYFTSEGFRLTILQSDFADFCAGNNPSRCITYDSSSLRPTLAVPLTIGDRARLITWKFFALSDLLRGTARKIGDLENLMGMDGEALKLLVGNGPRSSTVASFAAFDLLTTKLRQARPGDVYLAHILAPHEPYTVGADCKYLPRAAWGYRHTPGNIEIRRRLYRNQVRCVTRHVMEGVKALDQSPARENVIVIVHGDHGSRITNINVSKANYGKFRDDELVASYSTLFAIRGPLVQAGYFTEPQPISSLLRDFAATDFRLAPQPRTENVRGVYLNDDEWRVRRRIPLPSSWTEAPPSHLGIAGGNAMTAKTTPAKGKRGDK